MKKSRLSFVVFVWVMSFSVLFAGCVGSYSAVRPSERDEILAAPEGKELIAKEPYEEAHRAEELVAFHFEIPGFPEWRRYYWTDKALWGNRGFVIGGPEAQFVVRPETLPFMSEYARILEDLNLKLTEVVRSREGEIVIIEQPIYDQRRAFEEARLAEEAGLPTAHTVRKGESLWLIAGYPDVYGNPLEWPSIYQANRDRVLNPDLIYPEQQLRIPRRAQSFVQE